MKRVASNELRPTCPELINSRRDRMIPFRKFQVHDVGNETVKNIAFCVIFLINIIIYIRIPYIQSGHVIEYPMVN